MTQPSALGGVGTISGVRVKLTVLLTVLLTVFPRLFGPCLSVPLRLPSFRLPEGRRKDRETRLGTERRREIDQVDLLEGRPW